MTTNRRDFMSLTSIVLGSLFSHPHKGYGSIMPYHQERIPSFHEVWYDDYYDDDDDNKPFVCPHRDKFGFPIIEDYETYLRDRICPSPNIINKRVRELSIANKIFASNEDMPGFYWAPACPYMGNDYGLLLDNDGETVKIGGFNISAGMDAFMFLPTFEIAINIEVQKNKAANKDHVEPRFKDRIDHPYRKIIQNKSITTLVQRENSKLFKLLEKTKTYHLSDYDKWHDPIFRTISMYFMNFDKAPRYIIVNHHDYFYYVKKDTRFVPANKKEMLEKAIFGHYYWDEGLLIPILVTLQSGKYNYITTKPEETGYVHYHMSPYVLRNDQEKKYGFCTCEEIAMGIGNPKSILKFKI